jgi:hypothetical protein
MMSPYKLSATRGIFDWQFPIADFWKAKMALSIGNWKLKIGNSLGC